MTDKGKIKAKIEQLMYGFNLEADIASCEDAETEKLASIKYQVCKKILEYINSMQEEPVSEDLEEEIQKTIYNHFFDLEGIVIIGSSLYATVEDMVYIAKHFANWQKEQFEKELFNHCDELTKEQAQIESEFITQHLKENNRPPTFIDAIEYGKKLQNEQIVEDAVEAKVYNKAYPTEFEIETNTFMQKLKHGDKVKVIVIKED